ncbi:DUF805 domain-containing protein [Fodinicurvata sp. EGI_FJ10296]|uniref:DUF805 domain-containing protein n=1 Tax=Fodinicurvata sp. EGI_FJ10296 TaxID=3231908 RepID=UPI00345502FB
MGNLDLKFMFLTPEGRVGRQTWWIGVGLLFIASLILNALFGSSGFIQWILSTLILIAGLMLHIKRCHDRDKSGWWCLLLFIPIVGFLWALIDLGILEGSSGANQYGPSPA